MKKSTLAYLNRLLRDYLGTTPAGGPLYRWFHSRDRELSCWLGRLDSASGTKAEYELVPQVWEQRWVLGMWTPPSSRQMWEAQFQGQIPYPRNGFYIACSIPSDPLLERGIEPNERITMYTIHLRRQQIALGMRGVLESYRESREYGKRNVDREVDAALSDRWTNCEPKVPGAAEQLAG